jgi:hypothetical protein
VHGVVVALYVDAVLGQFVPKSYRPRAGGRRRGRQRRDPLGQLLGRADERLPEALARLPVESGEDLAAAGVEDGEVLTRQARLPHPPPQGVERADAGQRQAEAGGEAAAGGDPDPQAGEGAGPEADREQLDPLPAAGRGRRPLDLLQQRGRMPRRTLGADAEQRLVEDLTIAPGAGAGVGGRGVEADDGQLGAASSS